MNIRSSLSVINFRQFLLELCPFWNLEYWKYTVFCTFLLHALTYLSWNFAYDFVLLYYSCQFASIFVGVMPLLELRILKIPSFPHFSLTCFDIQYWAEILLMTLFYCTTNQVRVSSISVNFCMSFAPFVTENTGNTQFFKLFSYMFWHIELKFLIWLCVTVVQIKFKCRQFALIFVGVMPLLELRILKIPSFPHFSLTCFDIQYWTEILLMTLFYCTSDQVWCVVNFRQFLCELCPLWNWEYWKYPVFHTFLLHVLTYWA